MKLFEDFEYERIDINKIVLEFKELIEEFTNSGDYNEQDVIISKIYILKDHCETMMGLVEIRNAIDTCDEYYEEELDYMDEITPIYEDLNSMFYKALVNSKFKIEHEKKLGKQIFKIADLKRKIFIPEVLNDLSLENKLQSQYGKLKGSASILFKGSMRNLEEMVPFTESIDRETRQEAQKVMNKFYSDNEAEFDDIYDQLVKVRHQIAEKLGYENFVEVGYNRMLRSDYNAEMVSNFREQIYEVIVPFATKWRGNQAKRLNLKELNYYDEPLSFVSGNAIINHDADGILEKTKIMFEEMSEETKVFANYMLDKELIDIKIKPGKLDGGFCSYLNDYQAPFVFGNFSGTSTDVDLLTHEMGHAFQSYMSKGLKPSEYYYGTAEVSEVHSIGMEFLSWPWMESFFGNETEKYKYIHLSKTMLEIPYMALVDEFQHWVYENPHVSSKARKTKWREIEKKYLPHRMYDGNKYLENGAYWHRQIHIFLDPFYYIDYALASTNALEIWGRNINEDKLVWDDYLKLCKLGGSQPFLNAISLANLSNPFENGTLRKIVTPAIEWLHAIDISKM